MNDQPGIPEQDTQDDPGNRDEENSPGQSAHTPGRREIWPQFRRLLTFQIKLYIDALRDLIMSPLSVVAFVVDAVQGNQGDRSHFESLLKFGRKTEQAINLFDQHDVNDENFRGVDTLLLQVEELVRKEYTQGSVSATARDSIGKALDGLRKRINNSDMAD